MASVVAAMPWTYWLAPPILAVTLLFLVAFGAWYLKRVVEPRLLRSDLAQAGGVVADGTSFPTRPGSYPSRSTEPSGRSSPPAPSRVGPEEPAG